MEFGLKDLIYIVSFTSAIVALWVTFKNRVSNLEEKNKTVRSIVFKPNGEMGVVTSGQCEKSQAAINQSISKTDAGVREIVAELKAMNDNIIIIMTHLNINIKKE